MSESNSSLRISLFGAAGRMGRAVLDEIVAAKDLEVAYAVERSDREGWDLGGQVTVSDDDLPSLRSDVWVDISLPEGAMRHAHAAGELGIPLLIGTTGFNDEQRAELAKLPIPHIIAPNLSIGVNLLFEMVGKLRRSLGSGYDVAVIEQHHKHKVDAPSGTAAKLAERLEEEGDPVQVVSVRAGEIVGEHEVLFAADGERVKISHSLDSRSALARGVPPAVRFLARQSEARAYSMADVLGLSDA